MYLGALSKLENAAEISLNPDPNSPKIFETNYVDSSYNDFDAKSPYDSTYNENVDVFIAKFDSNLSINEPTIVSQPQNEFACEGKNIQLKITAENAQSYQWQLNTGSDFSDITDDATYSYSNYATLYISNLSLGMDTYQYRCLVTNYGGTTISDTVILEVQEALAITQQPQNTDGCERGEASFTVEVNSTSTYQ